MHEMSLMQSIFEQLETEIKKRELTKVSAVKLAVGQLTAAVPSALEFCFEYFAKDTVCEGAELIIEEVPAKGYCHDCEQEFAIDKRFICPKCNSTNTETISGRELYIDYITVDS
ncbi:MULTISPECIES: hydrogenase maturation nickel metallochaperone HypA [unclassified Candidatus Frackibacter]|uniref:hydrogenase maturation nickel metallochaperone HypA n=1 Tax=unclassified Candidatus Frackibacter TaxID=2648818 RepID=UPI000889B3A8|nr:MULTISPECIES: hydrogenase maturation nickel metallochaperone HypA [unclassified Candidatus Frackibacter]SDC77394.1 hydrogenase nickel incorporation protein HypA/HybF [Candidatus Frackibacter sp. WG11]SEM90459.1 hydrogenase nickel incorporation protein HypA/HybF [Candidatus Frackibacter sp. WG12]SFM00238.1 hydrogenase nickel incorporation protein HypA/HybF [Candidatus Frackibacter sp. WG13]